MLIASAADVGLVARARRAALKLGQADVARRVGVGRQWVVRFESGHAGAELALVLRTLAVLGLEARLQAARVPPGWTLDLTATAGTRARPYGRARRPRHEPAKGV